MQTKNQSLSEIKNLLEQMKEKYSESPNVTQVTNDTFLNKITFVPFKTEKKHYMYESRIHNILKRIGINTVEELLNHYHTNGNSISITNIGPKYKKYIIDFIEGFENPQQPKLYSHYDSSTLFDEKLSLEEDLYQLWEIIEQLNIIKDKAEDPETLKSLSSDFKSAKNKKSIDEIKKKLSTLNLCIDTQIDIDSLLETANNLKNLLEEKKTELCKEFNILIGLNPGGDHYER